MSRLYYEPEIEMAREAAKTGPKSPQLAKYGEKITKLIPGEILAAYLAFVGILPGIGAQPVQKWTYLGFLVLCLVLTPIYLLQVADKEKAHARHIILSTLAFVVWVFAISGTTFTEVLGIKWYNSAIASVILVTFTLISGAIPLKPKSN